eukprot:scaffold5296_cov105-Isochrysis_galbana.AAC.4
MSWHLMAPAALDVCLAASPVQMAADGKADDEMIRSAQREATLGSIVEAGEQVHRLLSLTTHRPALPHRTAPPYLTAPPCRPSPHCLPSLIAGTSA